MNTNNFAWRRWLPIFLGMSLGLTACKGGPAEGCRTDAAADAPAMPLRVRHLEPAFFSIKTPATAQQFMATYPAVARYYLQRQPANEQDLANN